MAKTKKDLQGELAERGIEFDPKAKVAELEALLDQNQPKAEESQEKVAEEVTEEVSDGDSKEDNTDPNQAAEETVAKAGKRSNKALREEAERQEKEERKASGETASTKPKQPIKPTRSRLERRAKGYRKNAEQIDRAKTYPVQEAAGLAKKTSHVKFDATVELHINLSVDPRQADQNIRDTLVLPAGSGKNVRVAVFTEDEAAAKNAGADIAGSDALLAEFDKGNTNFDILVATPNLMPKLGKYARTLGPRGLMPNPKSGTVTNDIAKAVAEAKAGRVEYRVDSTGIVHVGVGKVSFEEKQLTDNIQAVLASIRSNKPQGVKGAYIKSIYLTTSMGPSISVDVSNV
jgi:ribosomal protein L1